MTHGIDYSNARYDPAVLKAAGVTHVFRYIDRTSWPKSLTAAEAQGMLDAGIRVALDFEEAANQATWGAAQGHADAVAANQYADQIGAPKDAAIYFSVDTSATYDEVAPYFHAAKQVSERPVAIYGPLPVGIRLRNEGTVVSVWVANAASWSGFGSWQALHDAAVAARADVIQHLQSPLNLPPGYDYNEVLGHVPAWGDPAPPPPAPSPTIEDEMYFFKFKSQADSPNDFDPSDPKGWGVWVTNFITRRHIQTPTQESAIVFVRALHGQKTDIDVVAFSQFGGIPVQAE